MATESGYTKVIELCEEFAAKVRAGLAPQVEDYIAEYPKLADEIREAFSAILLVEDVAGECGISSEVAPEVAPLLPLPELGDFQLLREIGRGGMGVVYLAEQISLGRRVALKVLPATQNFGSTARQRFQLEARIAASIDHPHIVPVYAVGSEGGHDFYAMQYIDGASVAQVLAQLRKDVSAIKTSRVTTITAERALDSSTAVEETVRKTKSTTLRDSHTPFSERTVARIGHQIATALATAHGHGIVHRDVKPSNILLDRQGKPYLADFGLAYIEQDQELTASGTILGSLPYMGPERLDSRRYVVDHRADQFGLAATLYEMLTNQRAIAGTERHEIIDQLRSANIISLRQVNSRISSDLETIIHKGLQAEPSDRYESMNEMADDLLAYLEHRPINARKNSALHRIRRWGERNPVVAGLTTAVAVLLIASTIISAVMAMRLDHIARDRSAALEAALRANEEAVASRRQAESLAASESQARANAELSQRRAERSEDFLIRALRSPSSDFDGRNVTVFQVLERTRREIENDLRDDPDLQVHLLLALSQAYDGLSLFRESLPIAERAWVLSRQHRGDSDRGTLTAQHAVVFLLRKVGRFEESKLMAQECLARCLELFGDDDELTLDTRNKLAAAIAELGDELVAREMYRENFELASRALSPTHHIAIESLHNLAGTYRTTREPEKAIDILQQIYELRLEHLGSRAAGTLSSRVNWGGALRDARRTDEALEVLTFALDECESILGGEDTTTLLAMNNLAMARQDAGDLDGAIALMERAVEGLSEVYGAAHPDTLLRRFNLANLNARKGNIETAIELVEAARDACRRSLGERHHRTLIFSGRLGLLYRQQDRIEEAILIFQEAIENFPPDLPPTHFDIIMTQLNLATIYCQEGQGEAARDLLDQIHEPMIQRFGPLSDEVRNLYRWRQIALLISHSWERALENAELWYQSLTKMEPLPQYEIAWCQIDRAASLYGLGRIDEALQAAFAANEGYREAEAQPFVLAWPKNLLGMLLAESGELEGGEPWLIEGGEALLRDYQQLAKHHHWQLRRALENLVEFYTRLRPDETQRQHWANELAKLN